VDRTARRPIRTRGSSSTMTILIRARFAGSCSPDRRTAG
jgi:hypothetical protein